MLAPLKVNAPAPSCLSSPVPKMTLGMPMALLRLNTKVALLVMPPLPKLPVVVASPTCKVPALMVVVPV